MVSCQRLRAIVHKAIRSNRLVYYEDYESPEDAIMREKEIISWRRQKKNALVETVNPRWSDLRHELFGDEIESILSRANR